MKTGLSLFQVISVEFFHTGENGHTKDEMRQFMESKGFVVHSEVTHPENLANDFIFVQKKVLEESKKPPPTKNG